MILAILVGFGCDDDEVLDGGPAVETGSDGGVSDGGDGEVTEIEVEDSVDLEELLKSEIDGDSPRVSWKYATQFSAWTPVHAFMDSPVLDGEVIDDEGVAFLLAAGVHNGELEAVGLSEVVLMLFVVGVGGIEVVG